MPAKKARNGGGVGSRAAGPYDRSLGARLKEARKARSLTQQAMAELVGVSYQQWQKYEKGQSRMPTERLQAGAETLGVGVAWLTGRAEGVGFAEPPASYLAPPPPAWNVRRLSRLLNGIEDDADRSAVQHLIERIAGAGKT